MAPVDASDDEAFDEPSTVTPRFYRVWRGLFRGLVVAFAVLLVAVVALVRPDHWMVEHVEFRGAQRAELAQLRHLVDVRNGTTIWGADLRQTAAGAKHHPWVRDAHVWREWPDTLVVQVEEYQPVALLQSGGLFYVDADGSVFRRAQGEDLDYPIISGLDPKLGSMHPDLPRLVVRDALHLMDALDERGIVRRESVSEIAFSPARGFTLTLRGNEYQARIVFGLENTERQLDRLSLLLDRGVDLSKPLLIDLAPVSLAIVRPLADVHPNG